MDLNEQQNAAKDEETFVHQVYEEIASHFSQTRYKPWSLVSKFISNLEPGSVGFDAGCGNGKYLGLQSILSSSSSKTTQQQDQNQEQSKGSNILIGFDRSTNLLKIAHDRGHEVFVADCLQTSLRPGIFDYGISIATIHHLSTWDRRKSAVQEMIKGVSKANGRILIQVWALEQENENALSRRKRLEPAQLSSAEAIQEQDVFVPWSKQNSSNNKESSAPSTYQRYYHLFKKGELENLVIEAANELGIDQQTSHQTANINTNNTFTVLNHGWERGNWWIELGLGSALTSLCE